MEFSGGVLIGVIGCLIFCTFAVATSPRSQYEPYPIEKTICLDNGFTWKTSNAGNRYGGGQCITTSNGLTWRIESK